MICQIQISRSNIGRGEMGEGRRGRRRDIKCLDKGRDLHGAIMMDEMIQHKLNIFRKVFTYSASIPGLCLSSLWSPNWIWTWRAPNCMAVSRGTGWVPSRMASLACSYSKLSWTGSLVKKTNGKKTSHETWQNGTLYFLFCFFFVKKKEWLKIHTNISHKITWRQH